MDFNKIKTFITIVECGSVSKAAKHLHRTQSAISQQIDVLEGELGITLFESLRGSVLLTSEGRKILETTREHFLAIENNINKNILQNADLVGTLRIGTSPSIGHYQLIKLLSSFRIKHPSINFEIFLQPDERIEQLLREDKIDAALIINFTKKSPFEIFEFISFTEHLVCSDQYFEEHFKTLIIGTQFSLTQFSNITGLTLIDFESDAPNLRHWLKKNQPHTKILKLPTATTIAVEDNECIKSLVLEDFGIAMLPEYMLVPELKSGKIVRLFPKLKPTIVGLDFAIRKGKNKSQSLVALIDHFKSNLKP